MEALRPCRVIPLVATPGAGDADAWYEAACALEPAHETWVLDDGARPWVAALASRLGARYRARTRREHAKAGSINALLPEPLV